jgi:hypothetical protein
VLACFEYEHSEGLIMETSPWPYVGIIWDVAPGSYQLIIYREGILGVHVPFWNRAGFATKYVRGGAPIKINPAGRLTREERRILSLIQSAGPSDLASTTERSFFIREQTIRRVAVRYRVAFSALDVWTTTGGAKPRTLRWTPSVNQLRPVRNVLNAAFGDRTGT